MDWKVAAFCLCLNVIISIKFAFVLIISLAMIVCVMNYRHCCHQCDWCEVNPIVVLVSEVREGSLTRWLCNGFDHDDVIKWKHFPRYWSFLRRIHRSPVNSPHKGQWRGALMFSLICARISGWVNNREAGDLRRRQAHCDVNVMWCVITIPITTSLPSYGLFSQWNL